MQSRHTTYLSTQLTYPKFNPKTKPNTNPIAADATYTELQAISVTLIVCARYFVQILGQVQHTNNKSTTNPQHIV